MAAGSELYTVGAMEGMGELGPNEDECVALPDIDSLVVLPWDRRFALAPVSLLHHDEPYGHDSRHVLKSQLDKALALGLKVNMGIEPEVYVLREVEEQFVPWIAEDLRNLPTRGYDLEMTILADGFLEPMVTYMNELGWDVYSFDHEGGNGQYEFEFRHTDALAMADRMIVFRLMAKHVARSLGCIASFMPKPFSDGFGSGGHVNMSLADAETGANVFDGNGNAVGDHGYSARAYQFTAGVLRHAGAITAVACPTVNSYKRLIPVGLMDSISWAPVYRAYGHNNRTLMCRMPANRHCLEVRIADSAANFYLVAAIVLAAGLEGIREGLEPGEAVSLDTYSVPDKELARAGIHRLPRNLGEALLEFESDPLAAEVFGPAFARTFLETKQDEWQAYNTVVSEWERDRYLHLW